VPNFTLLQRFAQTISTFNGSREAGWIEGREGKIQYCYDPYTSVIAIKTFEVYPQYQKRTLAKEIVAAACDLSVNTVRIDSTLKRPWVEKLATQSFPDRRTRVVHPDSANVVTIEYVVSEE